MGGGLSKELRELRKEVNKNKSQIDELKKRKELEESQIKAPTRQSWRKFEYNGGWNLTYEIKLKNNIKDNHRQWPPRILLLGLTSAGKLSFINSVISAVTGELLSPATNETGATQFREKELPTELNSCFVRVIDLSELTLEDIKTCLGGNIRSDDKSRTLADNIHCVVTVVESAWMRNVKPTEIKVFKTIRRLIQDQNVQNVIVLTKIDIIDADIEKDITTVYHSQDMREIVDKASENLGVPTMHIFPVRNYTGGTNLNSNMNILLMLAFRKIMSLSDDYIEAVQNQESIEISHINYEENSSDQCL